MDRLIIWIRVAGVVHVVILAGNFILPAKLECRSNLAHVSPMIRHMFIVHWAYIVAILGFFSVMCFFFAPDLAGASRLGRFLSATLALFWLPRIPIQVFLYDAELRRKHRLGDVMMLLALAFLVVVFGFAALRGVL